VYTQEAIRKYGFFRGIFLGGKRLLKCHPFHPGGVDPLP
jgi:putative component of membrane protein insertase Oxa1/YidC/SpoIIIJ protein YidD